MSRCSICDYSQSADSLYNDGLMLHRTLINNRVVYHSKLKKDICVRCLEDYFEQQNYWSQFNEEDSTFNAYEASFSEGEIPEYTGCTDVKAD